MRVHVLRTFVTHLLVHMHQKEKITLEIAAKIIKTLMPQSNENKSCMRVNSLSLTLTIVGVSSLKQQGTLEKILKIHRMEIVWTFAGNRMEF